MLEAAEEEEQELKESDLNFTYQLFSINTSPLEAKKVENFITRNRHGE